MSATGPGLGDVVDRALAGWQPRPARERTALFGAAGPPGPAGDSAMYSLLSAEVRTDPTGVALAHPMDRLFATSAGRRAAQAVGNETLTLGALQRLGAEIMADSVRELGIAKPADRMLVLPSRDDRPPVLLVMSPEIADIEASRVVSDELDLPFELMRKLAYEAADDTPSPEAAALRAVLEDDGQGLAELFLVAQPEIVRTRRPRMIPLCAPSPHVRVERDGAYSTAGIFCRDATGALGVTGCYHGTGPVGTQVIVGLHQGTVAQASQVQDLVFVPLYDGFNVPPVIGLGGVRADREPARADHVRFDGATNPNRATRVFGTDNGLLRARPSMQLKVQTDPDTDEGDSGSALIDEHDRVIGFAFERTAYDDYPQFTDWIWAANALRALELQPYRAGD